MENAAQYPAEITVLGWSVVLLLVQVALQATVDTLEHGLGYAVGPKDERRQTKGVYAGRISRAFYNLLETFPAFAALALALALTGRSGGIGETGAWIWFWARVVYVPAYVAGIPGTRSVIWGISVVGLVMMVVRLLG